MKSWCLLQCFVLGAGFILSSCGAKSELKKAREAIKEAADTIAVAVPGERYLRLFDAVHKGTAVQQKEAKDFIKSAFKIDLDVSYEASVTFTFNTKGQPCLRSDIFAGSTPTITDVKSYVAHSLNPDPPISSSITLPMTESEIHQRIEAIASGLMDNMYASPQVQRSWNGTLQMPQLAPYVVLGRKGASRDNSDERAALAKKFADAVLAVRGERTLPVTSPRRSKKWKPLAGLDYLFVLIAKNDFEKAVADGNDKDFVVRLFIHQEGQPDKPLYDNRPFELRAADFRLASNLPVTHPTNGEFVWAVRKVTDYQSISEATLKALREMREVSAKMDKELDQ